MSLSETGKTSVTDAVWRWRGPTAMELSVARERRYKRLAIETAVGALVGIGLLFYKAYLGIFVISFAMFLGISGIFFLKVHAAVKKGFALFGRFVGWLLSWLFLPIGYFVCFLPLRWHDKRKGRDRLARECPTSHASYWVAHQPTEDKTRYRKQF